MDLNANSTIHLRFELGHAVALPAKNDFVLLWDDLFNCCRADLQAHLNLMIISLIPSVRDFSCLYPFRSNNSLNCRYMLYIGLNSSCKTCDNLRMRGRTSKSARNDVCTSMHGVDFSLTFVWNIAAGFLKIHFHGNELCSNFESSEIQSAVSSIAVVCKTSNL